MQFKTKDLLVHVLPKAEVTKEELDKYCLLETKIHVCTPLTILGQPVPDKYCEPMTCLHYQSHRYLAGQPVPDKYCEPLTCGPHQSRRCVPTFFEPLIDPIVVTSPENLVKLRQDLQDTLKKLDEIEKENVLGPITSKEQADQVEAALNEALAQVRAAKAKLKK